MAFNLGFGLAGAGHAIADTAGKAALEYQKAALEEDKVRLADQLAGEREKASDTRRLENEKSLIPIKEEAEGNTRIRVNKQGLVDAAEVIKQYGGDQAYQDAMKKMETLKYNSSPDRIAATNASNVQIAAANLKIAREKTLNGLQDSLTTAPPEQRDAIRQRIKDITTTAETIKDEDVAERMTFDKLEDTASKAETAVQQARQSLVMEQKVISPDKDLIAKFQNDYKVAQDSANFAQKVLREHPLYKLKGSGQHQKPLAAHYND